MLQKHCPLHAHYQTRAKNYQPMHEKPLQIIGERTFQESD